MRLTDRAVKTAKPKERSYRLSDGLGMYVEITPAGGKLWRLKYRVLGKEKRLALGTYPDVSLALARDKRADARKLLAAGTDPSAHKKAAKRQERLAAANSFEAVAREWFSKQSHTWVQTHADDVLRRLEANLFTEIGATPIAALEAPELLDALRKIEDRGAFDLSHRVLQVAGQVFRYGIATGRCKRDLAADLKGALAKHTAKHQAALKPDQFPDLLRAIDRYGDIGDQLTGYALRMLALTFVRTGELIGATWTEFDLDGSTWIVPGQRMKMGTDHVVPLSRQAVELLQAVKGLGGGSAYVFPGRSLHKPISGNTCLFALYRLGFKSKMTGHGFRSIASTVLNETNLFRPDVIERQLAHCERNEIRGAYNRAEYLPERRDMMQWWADKLDTMAAGAEVIPLQRSA